VISVHEQSTIVASKAHVSSDLDGEVVILSLENGLLYGLDPIASRLWKLIQVPASFVELRAALLAEYDVSAHQLEADIRELLSRLAEERIIEISG
jgi:hypothetical protein